MYVFVCMCVCTLVNIFVYGEVFMYDMYLGVPQVFGKVDVEVKFGPFPEHTKRNQPFPGLEIFPRETKVSSKNRARAREEEESL